jgi:hypothetical protein
MSALNRILMCVEIVQGRLMIGLGSKTEKSLKVRKFVQRRHPKRTYLD